MSSFKQLRLFIVQSVGRMSVRLLAVFSKDVSHCSVIRVQDYI